ncbi:MAG: ribonuclease H-like domain-containing protein [Planctomycetes bacterium]|nr:ribonuclease H-like domain-containing protein [Planctomycetota bacterium]
MPLRDRLERILGPAPAPAGPARDAVERALRGGRARADIADILPGEDIGGGAFLVRRDDPVPAEFLAADPRFWAALAREPAWAAARHADVGFLDLETTGLAGGTGTVAFLIGLARIRDGRLETRQYFLRSHASEPAALARVEEDLRGCTHLVTFNGKCFDVPLLETRFVLHRRTLAPLPHLDLLHPARRVWRRRLDSCTLSRLESEVLGRPRHGDIDGSEIPQRWFDWLALGDPRPLAPVIEHNRLDLTALAALAGRLARLLERPGDAAHETDLFSLGAMMAKEGDARAEATLGEALSRGARDAAPELARVKKKRGAADDALPLWELAAREPGRKGLDAGVELAKHYEHREKNFARALELTRRLLERTDLTARERQELGVRRERLERRTKGAGRRRRGLE